jgi:hypothetical protein
LYQPDRAPIKKPNATDSGSKTSVAVSGFVVPFEFASEVELDPDGLALGADGLGLTELVGASVKDARAIDPGLADSVATEVAGVLGDALAPAIPPAASSLAPVNANTVTTVMVAMKDAIAPASQVARGARKPASIGGTSGTGKKRNEKTIDSIGSPTYSPLLIRTTLYTPATAHMARIGQMVFELKTSGRMLRRSSM